MAARRPASDYTTGTGTLKFAAGETGKSFSVAILEDILGERHEALNVALSNVRGR
jgi:hypothetical protein